jgi:hypothetical protein
MDPYAEPPPRRHSGCLWGCLGLLAALFLVIAGVFTFGAWHFYKGFEQDARVQAIMETVRHDARAEAVLGRNIKFMAVQTHTFAFSTGRGNTASYVLRLIGSAGEGELKVDLDLKDNGTKITLMILTGKDGKPHYLVGTPPKNPMMDDSI